MLSESMVVELASGRIRGHAIVRSWAQRACRSNSWGVPDTPENHARFIATIPLGRMCEGADMANVAVFLASDAWHFLVGMEVPVDGGRII